MAERMCPAPAFLEASASVDARFRDVNAAIDRAFDRFGALLAEIDEAEETELMGMSGSPTGGPRLEPEQTEVLLGLVSAARRVPRAARASFHLLRTQQGDTIIHRGLSNWQLPMSFGDARILDRVGLIALSPVSNTSFDVDITPEGFAFVESRSGQLAPIPQMTETVIAWVEGEDFRARHAGSYARWAAASERVGGPDAIQNLTVVGHDVREALQFFADELVRLYTPTTTGSDPTKTVDRIRSVIKHRAPQIGERYAAVLDAAIVYWGTVCDLANRQEHGALKEGEPLGLEDARRLVFHTAFVMFELEAGLGPAS